MVYTYKLSELTIDTRASQHPVGEAVRADGTLKDASEIEWIHSPTSATSLPFLKRVHTDEDEAALPELLNKRARVSYLHFNSGRCAYLCTDKCW